MHSILDSTKKALGLAPSVTAFDTDIIMHINSVFSTLNQLGIGPVEGFQIEDASSDWDSFLEGNPRLNFVKTYVYLKVRMVFDPPAVSFTQQAMKEQIQELEWRLLVLRDEMTQETIVDAIPAPSNAPIVMDGGSAEGWGQP